MSASMHPVPLRLGPYELVRRIATGGMAEVYLARRGGPHGFEKLVAVKRILPQFVRDPDFVAMFVDEARVCARLCHPNIVQVFDFGEHETDLYMAMEYVEGTTGAKLIRAAAGRNEEIPLDVTIHIILSVLRALEYAHGARDDAGRPLSLVHRDVSPGNLLIDVSGAVKLTDFGIARAAEFERRTDVGQLKGKLGYMSPEQVIGKELDARSDLFTLAIIFAELVALRPLFSGGRELDVLMRIRDADLSALTKTSKVIPDDVKAVLFKALARDPHLRFPSATAFAQALEEIVRRRRLQVGPSRLSAWLERLDLVTPPEGGALPEDDEEEPSGESTAILAQPDPSGIVPTAEARLPGTSAPLARQEVAPEIYRVRQGEDVRGPISFPNLIELFATGQANGESPVARESGRFRLAREYPELNRFVTSTAFRWDEEWPPTTLDRGPCDRIHLPGRLFRYALRRETGVLLLRDGNRRKKIYLVEGVPEFVVSTDKNELLGEYLIARGQVLRMEVEMALAMSPRFGGRLGDALVGLGVLRPAELFRAIHEQTQQRVLEVFRWSQGEWGFVPGERSHEETFPLGINSFELIARGIREGYLPEELRVILGGLGSEALALVPHPPVRPESFRLSDRELKILRSVGASTSLPQLIADVVAARLGTANDVYFTVFLGLSCQFLMAPSWVDVFSETA